MSNQINIQKEKNEAYDAVRSGIGLIDLSETGRIVVKGGPCRVPRSFSYERYYVYGRRNYTLYLIVTRRWDCNRYN